MSSPGYSQAHVSSSNRSPSISTNRASSLPSRPRLNPYQTPDRPILGKSPTSSSSVSSVSTMSTADSTFSIRSFRRESSPITPPNDFEESIDQWATTRPRNLYESPIRTSRNSRCRYQAIASQSKADEGRDRVEVQGDDEVDYQDVNNDNNQAERVLKIPGAFPIVAEEIIVNRRMSSDFNNACNSMPVQYPILPAIAPQCPKFCSYGFARKSAREINHAIRSLLQKPLKPHSGLTAGYIYAYAPCHIKIGQSSRAPETRMREWSKCRIPISKISKSVSIASPEAPSGNGEDAFYHYALVESILFEEFYNQRKWFECEVCRNNQRGPRRHTEWLEIDASTATHAIRRWRTWVEREKPFTSLGRLTAYWQWRVDELPKNSSSINWDDWTRPRLWEYCGFLLEQLSLHTSKLKPHFTRKDKQFWTMSCFFVFVSFFIYTPEFTVSFAMVLFAL
ncbi:hypothetical protein BHYA_0101g00200 [Botrytis hyacinthi]|uniref:Bacteriophage T5 Orf172 DNA-binding domain-containing protein n=1 Tax=Botrytis hyacinthi TaxID=278943 RepID=A0A4Z1GRB1_9HELO|nr:hypothetical protein BHYA_0101g00200 [Botrytis hyacinthi]